MEAKAPGNGGAMRFCIILKCLKHFECLNAAAEFYIIPDLQIVSQISMWRPASLVQLYDILGEDLYKEYRMAKGECRWMSNVTTILEYLEYDLDLDMGYTMCSKTVIDERSE